MSPSSPAPSGPSWPEIDALAPQTALDVRPTDGWYAAGKSAADFVMAVGLLVPALPVIGVCWAVVKWSSPGPGFYSQTRLGLDGRRYPIMKIRTMTLNAEAGGAQWAQKVDCRVTKFGKFLRATHLDELPQLFNVLRGEMSLVGPRPERPEMIEKKGLNEHVPGYSHRLRVKPGVTGLAQIQLPADTDLNSVRHKVVYDLYYIENAGLWLDVRIITATAMKTAGLNPRWLRRLFRLPTRDVVGGVFRRNITPPADSAAYQRLQPA